MIKQLTLFFICVFFILGCQAQEETPKFNLDFDGPREDWIDSNHIISRQNYKDHVLDGPSLFWNGAGVIIREEFYTQNKPTGKWVWRNDAGKKSKEIRYTPNGKQHRSSRYWDNGNKMWEIYYENGKKSGRATYWTEEQVKLREDIYHDGVLVANVFSSQSYQLIGGKATYTEPQCGGALRIPSPPEPLSHQTFYIRQGDSNKLVPVFRQFITDESGQFMTYLTPGKYCFIHSRKLLELDLSLYMPDILATDPNPVKLGCPGVAPGSAECYKKWWSRCDLQLEVGEEPIYGVNLSYYGRCFVGNDPCATYLGPWPQ